MTQLTRAIATNPTPRWATRCQFFCPGFIFAIWGVHISTVKAHYAVDEVQLGLKMLVAGVGALLGLARASRWIWRHGARHGRRVRHLVPRRRNSNCRAARG